MSTPADPLAQMFDMLIDDHIATHPNHALTPEKIEERRAYFMAGAHASLRLIVQHARTGDGAKVDSIMKAIGSEIDEYMKRVNGGA